MQIKIKWSTWRGLNTGCSQLYTRLRALWLYTWSGRAFQEGVLLRGFHLILWFRTDFCLCAECGFPETRPWNTRWVTVRHRHRFVLVYLPPTPTPLHPMAAHPAKNKNEAELFEITWWLNCSCPYSPWNTTVKWCGYSAVRSWLVCLSCSYTPSNTTVKCGYSGSSEVYVDQLSLLLSPHRMKRVPTLENPRQLEFISVGGRQHEVTVVKRHR